MIIISIMELIIIKIFILQKYMCAVSMMQETSGYTSVYFDCNDLHERINESDYSRLFFLHVFFYFLYVLFYFLKVFFYFLYMLFYFFLDYSLLLFDYYYFLTFFTRFPCFSFYMLSFSFFYSYSLGGSSQNTPRR